jgi:hypothetical protein
MASNGWMINECLIENDVQENSRLLQGTIAAVKGGTVR